MATLTRTLPTGATGTAPTFTEVEGSRVTSGSTGLTEARPDINEDMIVYENFRTPISSYILADKFGSKPTGNQYFQWMETALLPATDTISFTGGSTTATATPGDATLYQLGTRFVVDRTGDVCVVSTDAATPTITKVGSGNLTTAAGDTIHFMGTVFEQGSNSSTAVSVDKAFRYNYTEIHKKAVQETGSRKATVEYSTNDWDLQKLNRWAEFKESDMEYSLIFGVRDADATGLTGSYYQYYSGGLFDSTAGFISTYWGYDGTAPSEGWFFNTLMPGIFLLGSDRKTLLVGSAFMSALTGFSKDKLTLNTEISQDGYGKRTATIFSDFGTLDVKWHPMLSGSTFSQYGIVLDLIKGKLSYRHLSGNGENRDIQFRDYREYYKQADSEKGEWFGEFGWQIEGNEYHHIIKPA